MVDKESDSSECEGCCQVMALVAGNKAVRGPCTLSAALLFEGKLGRPLGRFRNNEKQVLERGRAGTCSEGSG